MFLGSEREECLEADSVVGGGEGIEVGGGGGM